MADSFRTVQMLYDQDLETGKTRLFTNVMKVCRGCELMRVYKNTRKITENGIRLRRTSALQRHY